MHILIGADVVATEKNVHLFTAGNIEALIGHELHETITSADALIFNIEAPITDKWTPIKKPGSPKANLRMPEAVIKGYEALNPSFVTLANNHIMDQSVEGLHRTMQLLSEAGIPYAGVGETLNEASKPFFINVIDKTNNDIVNNAQVNNTISSTANNVLDIISNTSTEVINTAIGAVEVKIGIYCCAEHEFSIATKSKPGANPFDPLESLDHILEAKKHCDYLIVLYHGGREFYRYPSPELQHRFRRMADKGADLVIAQHTHCIGCFEEYKGATLVYGQGNFIFDYKDDEYWNSGMLVDVNITSKDSSFSNNSSSLNNNKFSSSSFFDYSSNNSSSNDRKYVKEQHHVLINYIPFIKSSNGRIRLAQGQEKEVLLKGLCERSEQIRQEGGEQGGEHQESFVEEHYKSYLQTQLPNLLRVVHGNNLVFRVVNKLLKIFGYNKDFIYKMYNDNNLLGLLNYVECEAHVEALIKGIRDRRKMLH